MTVGIHIYKTALKMNHRQSTSLLQLFVKHYTSSATTPVACTGKEPSFAESYLVDKFGFSPQSALSLSRNLNFKTADIPDSVLSSLREYGFSETQLSHLVRKYPTLLLINSEKILTPKLEFFLSKGVSRAELVKVSLSYPYILLRSLENHIVPFYDYYRSVLKSDEKVSRIIVRNPSVLYFFRWYTKANINHLRHNSVPESKIATLVRNWPQAVTVNSERFNEIVGFVKEKGLNPSNLSFVKAVATVASMSKQTWEKKVLFYESWGWSKEDVNVAFKKYPQCMTLSESKINAVMGFLINEVGCEPSYIVHHPVIFSYSLQNRIIPRCSVIKVLVSKGMVKLTCVCSLLNLAVELFEKKLMTSYGEEAPYLLELYREKMNVPK